MKRFMLMLAFILCIGIVPYASAEKVEEKSHTETPDALMLRFPDVSADSIVFAYAGDLWIVPKEGGVARRLSSPNGNEQFPKFSPDGSEIAFSGNYDGNTDVYVIPSEGGPPKRLTHHPDDDLVVDWYPDGRNILFRSNMMSPSSRYNRLFRQPVEGGIPEALPLPYGELGSFSPDGRKLAFQYQPPMPGTWKRYRGGMASNIWIYDADEQSLEKLTDFEGTDALPMWHDNNIYFISDRGKENRLNIWVYDTKSGEKRQLTKFSEYDVKWTSLGPEDIVFENGGRLFLLNLGDESVKEVEVEVPYDLPEMRPQLKDLSKYIDNFSISPTGKRALFEARGEVLTVPAGEGVVRNLTRTSGAAERYPAWSPDGRYVAYFSDESGEYELYYRPGDGEGEAKRVTKNGAVYRYKPVWSPDSKQIAFSDKTGGLYIVDMNTGSPKLVDKDERELISAYSWSPDGKWLAYTRKMQNGLKSVFLYDTQTGKSRRVTSNFYNDSTPVFDPEGRYLYFYSDRSFTPVYGDMDETWIYPNSTQIYALPLKKATKSPLAPKNIEEDAGNNHNGGDKNEEDGAFGIDFDGIEKRAVKIPVNAGNFGQIDAVNGKIVYLRFPPAGGGHNGPSGVLQFYDLNDGREKTVISNINDYRISSNGAKVIYRSGNKYGIIDLAEGKNPGDGQIDVSRMKVFIDPRLEWSQIFNEAWRIQRDFFYDPGMHGTDWAGVKQRYQQLLPHVVDREDLSYVIGEMAGELNSSHTYIGGGDIEQAEDVPVGLLGADFDLDVKNSAYRIKKIYDGGEFNTDTYSPLGQPGLGVKKGDYLLAVNGRALDVSKDPWAAFQGLGAEVVTLKVSSSPNPKDSRDVVVKLITPEEDQKLRYLEWVEGNLRKVNKATEGKVGYVYVPDTGHAGQNELVRQFTPQIDKEAMIIDERFNGGGQIPDRFIELLDRPTLNYWALRDFKDWKTPTRSQTGPKVMIINGWSGSGGDAFPYYFRKEGLGPLVGTRTLGALIGIGGNPGFIDGGFFTAPSYAFWNSDGRWEIEGYGVDPDYEVDDLPANLNETDDPQLDKAIEVVNGLLEKSPPVKPARPRYEDRSGPG